MKKYKILLMIGICTILLSSCNNTDINANQKGEFLGYMLDTDDYYDTEWGIYPGEFEIDEKLALDIGNAVMKSICSDNEKDVLEKTELVVYKIKENIDKDVFVVCRRDPNSLGGACYVAINKKDGAIIKIWGDE